MKTNCPSKSKRTFFREVLCALSGYAGDVFISSDMDGSMCLNQHIIDHLLHPAQVTLLNRLCHIINHYKVISDFISDNRTSPDAYTRSLVKGIMSVITPYQKDLIYFDKFIDDNPNISLTKFNMFIKYEQMFIILNQMIVRFKKEKHEFVTIMDQLSELSLHGNLSINQTCLSVLSHFEMLSLDIWSWMMFGHLRVENDKFFIRKDENGEVKLDMSCLPSCIDGYVASKIHKTGQTVQLAHMRSDKSMFDGKEMDLFRTYNAISIGSSANKFEFDVFIDSVAQIASEYSWRYIIQEEHLIEHLEIIRDFYLTGKEELWYLFLGQFGKLKFTNENTYNQREIQSTFNNSMSQVVNCGDLEELTHSFEVTYNGLMTLKYKLPETLHCVISTDSFEKYNEILNFMLKLYTARMKLQSIWLQSMKDKCSETIDSQSHRERWALLHRLRCFIESLYYFFKVDVFGRLFQDLLQSIKSTKDIEAVQKEHQKFVAELLVQSFIKTTPIKKCIYELFVFCNQICNSHALSDEFASKQIKNLQRTSKHLYHLLANVESIKINPMVSHLLTQIEKCISF